MPIALGDVLDQGQIALQLRSRRSAKAVREIVHLLEQTGKLREPVRFLHEVLAREQANST